MRIETSMTDTAVLQELGDRISRHRLNKNMTQLALAEEAGISLPTLQRIEKGQSTTLTNVLRTLRVLKLLGNLEIAVPAPPVSPRMQALLLGKERQRASSKSQNVISNEKEVWTWGNQK